jgi:hypothetical protein
MKTLLLFVSQSPSFHTNSILHSAPNNMSREHFFVLMQHTGTRYLDLFLVRVHNVPSTTNLEELNHVQGMPPAYHKNVLICQ